MKRALQCSSLAAIIPAGVFSYRSQTLWFLISMFSYAVLWLLFYLRYARRVVGTNTPRFDPVTLLVGVSFVIGAAWEAIKLLPGMPIVGALLLTVMLVLLFRCGLIIIRNQLRLRRPSR
jgi:hypothetical protein